MRQPISIHALRGEGDKDAGKKLGLSDISIHALRGEGDKDPQVTYWMPLPISIHALRGEGDPVEMAARYLGQSFQSTPSVGRATPRRLK